MPNGISTGIDDNLVSLLFIRTEPILTCFSFKQFLNQARAHSRPTPGFLKLLYEKCVCVYVCMYVCIFVCLSAPT